MRKLSLWCAAALLPLLAACSFSLLPRTEYTEPKTFDLISPSPIDELPFLIDVDAFSTECSGRYTMVFREEANRVSVDEYSRWSMPPGAMLTKYLSARFASPSNNQGREKKPGFELDGTVLSCELNKATMQVDLMIHYFIVESGKEEFRITGTEDYSIPVNE
ncbi:MAG: membrane integrity-associated transporter subunit PqiC, partial [Lentisphaeria bacterium]|nr:membrane integrity-associated transporter subunit PqiC [Lentisphaeria bacterium]